MNRRIMFLLLLIVFVSVTGCMKHGMLIPRKEPTLQDLPVPLHFKQYNDHSFSLVAPPGKNYHNYYYKGHAYTSDVVTFFESEMSIYGWTFDSRAMDDKRIIMVFNKPGAEIDGGPVCIVAVRTDGTYCKAIQVMRIER